MEFTMSKFASEADLYKAKAEHFERKCEQLQAQNAVLAESNENWMDGFHSRKQLCDELLSALKDIANGTYDAWTNGAEAQRIALAAISKVEHP